MSARSTKIVPLLKALYKSCVRDSLVLSSVIVRHKVTVHENVSFTDYTSGLWLPDCSKLAKNPINDNDDNICWYNVIVKWFWCYCVYFSSLATGPSLTSISLLAPYLWQFSFIKHRPEIWKSELQRLRQVKDKKFVTNVSNEMLLNAAKCQGYSFYRFYVT